MSDNAKSSKLTSSFFFDSLDLNENSSIDMLSGFSISATNVEIFDNGNSVGSLTPEDDGWSISDVPLQAGVNVFSGIATDAAGNTTPIRFGFTIETGIQGQPWSAYESAYNKTGNLVYESYFNNAGLPISDDYIATLKDGDHKVSTRYLDTGHQDDAPEYSETDLYSPDYSVIKSQTFFGIDKTTIDGMADNLTIDSVINDRITGGGSNETFVFKPYFGRDVIVDFKVNGAKHDFVSLPSADFSTAAQVLANTYMSHGHAIINVTDADEIILQNVTKAELSANKADFKFYS